MATKVVLKDDSRLTLKVMVLLDALPSVTLKRGSIEKSSARFAFACVVGQQQGRGFV